MPDSEKPRRERERRPSPISTGPVNDTVRSTDWGRLIAIVLVAVAGGGGVTGGIFSSTMGYRVDVMEAATKANTEWRHDATRQMDRQASAVEAQTRQTEIHREHTEADLDRRFRDLAAAIEAATMQRR